MALFTFSGATLTFSETPPLEALMPLRVTREGSTPIAEASLEAAA